MEILVIHPGALGDIILALPALQILRENFPGSHLTLAANLDFAKTVAAGYADTMVSLSALPLHRLHGSTPVSSEDESLWRSYDRIISWTGAGHETFVQRFHQIHPEVLVVPWKPGPGERRHVSSIFADSLRPWISPLMKVPPVEIRLDPALVQSGMEWLRQHGWNGDHPILAIHPGAGSAAKRWPLERFRQLIHGMDSKSDLLVVVGPAETGLASELASGCGNRMIIAENLPLSLLAAALKPAAMFIGNDSGIAHLAAGLGTPCVILFGPTMPGQWAPLGTHVSALRHAGNCPACNSIPGSAHSCLENISPGAVLQILHLAVGKLGYYFFPLLQRGEHSIGQ